MPDHAWVRALRRAVQRFRGRSGTHASRAKAPLWKPGRIEKALFAWRDRVNWPSIARVIAEADLNDFDVIHLDGGLDFTRDGRFVRDCAARGQHVACFYHGSDLRNRGIIPAVDEVVQLRLTSEWDLMELDERLHYLYLPFDTGRFPQRDYHFHTPIRIAHASRNPYKGTPHVQKVVSQLARDYAVELVLIQGLPHAQAIERKYQCDIFVDQLTNEGGWGYGMSSVEALAMGMPVITNIPPAMEKRLGDHPFVKATPTTLADALRLLIANEKECRLHAEIGQQWVREHHDQRTVADRLYQYYDDAGWLR